MPRSSRSASPAWACLLAAATTLSACSDDFVEAARYEGVAYPDRRPKFDSAGRLLGYVANRHSDTVTVLDLDAMQALGNVPVGRDPVEIDGPRHFQLHPEADLAYVVLSYPLDIQHAHEANTLDTRRAGYVQALSLADLRPVGEVRLDPSSSDVVLSPSKRQLAVTHFDTYRAIQTSPDIEGRRAALVFVDEPADIPASAARARRIVLCVAPTAVVYGRDDSRVYVVCTGEDSIAVVDTSSGEVLSRVKAGDLPVNKPYAAAVNASGSQLVVTNQVAATAAVFTLEDTPRLLASTPLFGVPFTPAWLSESEFIVAVQGPGGVIIANADTGEILRERTFVAEECENPTHAQRSADGRFFLVCEADQFDPGTVVELDPETLEVQSRVDVGAFPDRLILREP